MKKAVFRWGLFLPIALLLTSNAFAQLTVSPAEVVFTNTPVGPNCPGTNCSYAIVTITNTSSKTETLTFEPTSGTFWATFGGTCNNTYSYQLPGNTSCTFEWGFKPPHPGKFTGTGTISYKDASGAVSTVGVALVGKGTPTQRH